MSASSKHNSEPRASRRWLFRLVSVLLGLSVFGVAEGLCTLLGWGRPTDFDDPFVGFSEIHPLFVPDESGTRYRIAESRRKFFAPDSFPAQKPADGFRIFCLGGSTVQGRPYSTETSFTTWLQLALETADKRRDWDVINCGGISYASYRLVPILEECLRYEPDLFIICTGHNEFLEERTYEHVKHAPALLSAVQEFFARFRTYVLLREGLLRITGQSREEVSDDRPLLGPEVDALLDYNEGLKAYHRDDEWRAGVIEHYENNLCRMIGLADKAGVPVLLIHPPSNLADTPPFKSEHRQGLTQSERSRWENLIEQARSSYRDDLSRSAELLRQAIEIDGQYAATFYELGKCLEALGRYGAAREAFLQARELDVCPLRMLRPMEEALNRVARESGVPLIDAFGLLEARCSNGILDNSMLVDHVHPSFEGHQLIAEGILKEMVGQGWVQAEEGWQGKAADRYRRHFESLDDFYFLRGQRTLDSVRAWTQGKADGPPIETRAPKAMNEER